MPREESRRGVLRVLVGKEATGYEIHEKLQAAGVSSWPNHVYALLRSMEQEGLLVSRWVGGVDGGRRRRVYRPSAEGRRLQRVMLREAVALMMDAFAVENDRAVGPHADGVGSFLDALGVDRSRSVDIVMAVPSYDPLSCYPVEFRAFAEALPSARVHVVKPSGVPLVQKHPRILVLDGARSALPLRDRFADHLWLQGIPARVPLARTLDECVRVLKPHGRLFVTVASTLDGSRSVRANTFGEFASALFYEHFGEDGPLDLAALREGLRARFAEVEESSLFGNPFLAARGLLPRAATPRAAKASAAPARPRERVHGEAAAN